MSKNQERTAENTKYCRQRPGRAPGDGTMPFGVIENGVLCLRKQLIVGENVSLMFLMFLFAARSGYGTAWEKKKSKVDSLEKGWLPKKIVVVGFLCQVN